MYRADGYLDVMRVAQSSYVRDRDGLTPPVITDPAAAGDVRTDYDYDGLGRLTGQKDYDRDDPSVLRVERQLTYDARGQVTGDTRIRAQGTAPGSDVVKTVATMTYGTGSAYAPGQAVRVDSAQYRQAGGSGAFTHEVTARNTYSHAWYDGAVQAAITHDGDIADSGNQVTSSSYTYNAAGHLQSASVQDGDPRTLTYVNDVSGTVIQRRSDDANSSVHDHMLAYHMFAGRQLGTVSNAGYGEFTQLYAPTYSHASDSTRSSHVVRTGESLSSIAAGIWGDAGRLLALRGSSLKGVPRTPFRAAHHGIRLPRPMG